ncbi:hypothetical protein EL22_28530 [Halostagnicola sp. A56]|uniref:hypothetical protein n=1 Tax=Halostagnicola sp. A56 TaxID=1495067 RepID=UPI00065F6A4F|nr:hypothetical protein [Halostagnicola sp. A56]KMT45686.1 hypothetical protein EL22_28530 [Halostagnicola sp. A56]
MALVTKCRLEEIEVGLIVEEIVERVTLSDGWELTQAYDANGDESNVVVTQEGMNTEFTGTGIEDRINAQQAIQEAFDNTDIPGGGDDDNTDWWLYGLIAVFGLVIVGLVVLVYLLAVGEVTSVA